MKDRLYAEHRNLILKRAWEYQRQYPHADIDELIGEAHLIFCRAADTFDPQRGVQFTTHLYHQLGRLSDFCRGEVTAWREQQDASLAYIVHPELQREWKMPESAAELGEDARALLDAIFEGELDDSEEAQRKRVPNLSRAQQRLRQTRRWAPVRTKRAWEELRGWWARERNTAAVPYNLFR